MSACKYNDGIDCDDQSACDSCGWKPKEVVYIAPPPKLLERSKLRKQKYEEVKRLFGEGLNDEEIAEKVGYAKITVEIARSEMSLLREKKKNHIPKPYDEEVKRLFNEGKLYKSLQKKWNNAKSKDGKYQRYALRPC